MLNFTNHTLLLNVQIEVQMASTSFRVPNRVQSTAGAVPVINEKGKLLEETTQACAFCVLYMMCTNFYVYRRNENGKSEGEPVYTR